jgi:O-antigen ligase/Flp pilus assembly protein TadD
LAATRAARRAAAIDPVEELDFIERLRTDPLFIAAQVVFGLKLALTVLLFDPQAFDAFSLVKSAAAHATSLVLAVLLLGLVVTHGRRVLVWSPMHLAVAALIACYAAATVLALDPQVAVFGTWRRYLGFTQMADDAVVYVAAVLLLPTARDLARLAIVTLATGAVVVLYMFMQQLGLDPVKYVEGPRPIGTLGQPDLSGGYAGIVASTALAVAVYVRSPRQRVLFGALAAAALLAALFTNVRGGLIGLGLGFLVVVALVFVGERRPSRRVVAGIGVAAVLALIAVLASPLRARLGPGFVSDASAQSRLDTWGTALDLILRRPLLGLGPDNFAVAYPAFRTSQSVVLSGSELQNSTHSWLLQIATSTGILGLLAFLAVLGLGAWFGLGLARRGQPAALALVPLGAFFGQGLVTINDPGVDWIPWLCLGVIAGASGVRSAAPARRKRAPALSVPWRTRAGAVAAVAFVTFIVAAAAARDRVAASEHFNVSEQLVGANRGTEAIVEAQAALALDSRRPEYWSAVGAALNSDNKIAVASAAFAQAVRIGPSQPTFWRNLALMRLLLNDTRGAFAALERAIAADPWDGEAHDLLARVALLLGDNQRAAREGHLAAELRLHEPTVYEAPVAADIALGRLKEAEDLLRTGLTRATLNESISLHVLLAQVLHAAKRDAEARQELVIALTLDPSNKAALELQQQYR